MARRRPCCLAFIRPHGPSRSLGAKKRAHLDKHRRAGAATLNWAVAGGSDELSSLEGLRIVFEVDVCRFPRRFEGLVSCRSGPPATRTR
jgi:hypothetical protein